MESAKRLFKITLILIFVAFAVYFLYVIVILSSHFEDELQKCLESPFLISHSFL